MTEYLSYPTIAITTMPASPKSTPNLTSKLVQMLANKLSLGSAVVMAIAIACSTPALPARASLFDGPVDRLPSVQRDSLRNGQTVVTGEKGKYVARVLVNASPDAVWQVLTDYANLYKFIPNMSSSKILENRGNRKVIEQVDTRQVFLISIVSRTKLAIQETDRQQIDFRLLDGDLSQMEGYWKMEPVSTVPRRPPSQVLITYTVNAQPNSSTPTDAFYSIFKDALGDTLQAIKQEVGRRG
ncbi:SRPBCC family protein [Pseudanabaena sp. UWO310]|uniref:SRPBCC family protein n=1 Tax=Pseudanabaena sp. UWO310 TaxID=2480795 RepID=UPI00115B38F0|nr:SRPBCC family protein [Pseudanabaena sp. UWO310]TYQ27905.1 cyclase/dehydrase [Pseudanabaena sp. UWO310]